jgi:hypothetical protein
VATMRLPLAVLGLGSALLADSAAAQLAPVRLRFTAPAFSLRLQAHVSLAPQVRAFVRAEALPEPECPMPVYVPDLSRIERMPIARPGRSGYAARSARIGCDNPLGPRPAADSARTTRPVRDTIRP